MSDGRGRRSWPVALPAFTDPLALAAGIGVGVVVLAQVPTPVGIAGVALVLAGVALRREAPTAA